MHCSSVPQTPSGPPRKEDYKFYADRFSVVSNTKQWTAFGCACSSRDLTPAV